MPDDRWSGDDVAALVEKVGTFVATLIRRVKAPNVVLRKITNLTQELHEGELDIDRRVDALYPTTTNVAEEEPEK